ncbi:probable diphthine methyl ester synthase isoform X4 [Amborella trichopoda]|nr:probable diphthine methyl ester synthase isoform X4 [Amborella trichopoda]|eukprot:XP_020524164.1 probable diphthine methyl ester synthase isoform X4 [Amborella trichopoda]
MVEERVDDMLYEAREFDVAFLVVGDPFGATTHTDLVVRAKKLGVEVKVIHNASVVNAIGVCGLQLYRYGEIVSVPFFTETWRPDSFYEKICSNRLHGLHTLCLLDIRVKEPSIESLCRGKKCYEPPKFMTIQNAIEQLLEVEQMRGESVLVRFMHISSFMHPSWGKYTIHRHGVCLYGTPRDCPIAFKMMTLGFNLGSC